MRSSTPVFCEHANEVPHVCPCDADCYCKDHTCKGASPEAAVDWNLVEGVFHRLWGNAASGKYDKKPWVEFQGLLHKARQEATKRDQALVPPPKRKPRRPGVARS
jgi:hypothetical protein